MIQIMEKIYKFSILFSFALCLAVGANSQSKKEQKGDWLMKKFSYKAAANTFERALEQDQTNEGLQKKLAECYRMLNDPQKVVMWYEDIIDNDAIVTNEDKYYFAQALSSTGNYQEAKKWFSAYSELVPDDYRSKESYDALSNLELLYEDSALFELKKVYFNSNALDFSPAWYNDGLVFVSARTRGATKYNWNETSYLDLYYLSDSMQSIESDALPFYQKMNSKFHEGPLSFYNDDTKLVLTRNNYEKGVLQKSETGVARLKMYFSSIDTDGKWSKAQPFAHNNDEYSVGHPAINDAGNAMYFVSDMPGGYGGTDMYVSYLIDGQWSEPENLGADINTEGNEMFPFLHNDETIYFASNGHGGLGGLDIFRFEVDECEIENLGYPTNSSRDDFGLILNENGKYGYLSSNRDDPNGYDNIYRIDITEKKHIPMNVLVVDEESNKPIFNASVRINEMFGEREIHLITDVNGKISFPLPTGASYTVNGSMNGYEDNSFEVMRPKGSVDIILKLNRECLIANGSVDVFESDIPVDSILVILTDMTSLKRDTMLISENEQYEFCLVANNTYNIKIDKHKFFSKSIDFTTENGKPVQLDKVELKEIVVGKAIKLENIYYDLDKANIRDDAALELDKLAAMLEANPTISIELSSHTDSQGDDAYNLDLSDRRARSAVMYIISKGIGADRITARGCGETEPINHCANDIPCSSEEYQANRRTEFKVLEY